MNLVPLKKYAILSAGMFPFVGCGLAAHPGAPIPDAKFADSTFEPPQGSTLLPGRGYIRGMSWAPVWNVGR